MNIIFKFKVFLFRLRLRQLIRKRKKLEINSIKTDFNIGFIKSKLYYLKDFKMTEKSNSQWHGGKGSKIRQSSSLKNYSDGWNRIFGKKEDENKVKSNQQSTNQSK